MKGKVCEKVMLKGAGLSGAGPTVVGFYGWSRHVIQVFNLLQYGLGSTLKWEGLHWSTLCPGFTALLSLGVLPWIDALS